MIDWPIPGCGSSGVYSAGRLGWWAWSVVAFCGGYGSFLAGMALSGLWVGVLLCCAQSRELGGRAARLLRFILLVSFSDTSLVASMVDIVYDCHS